MGLAIETGSIRNLFRLTEIENQSFGPEAFSKQEIAYLLTDYNDIVLIARWESEIVGFIIGRIGMDREVWYLHILTLDVLPDYRGKGIGQSLINEIERISREQGVQESRLEVREDNVAALNLYRKLGYGKMGLLEGYYGNAHGLYLKKVLK
jgi:ribosomal-protein-alanine acetyltransferase